MDLTLAFVVGSLVEHVGGLHDVFSLFYVIGAFHKRFEALSRRTTYMTLHNIQVGSNALNLQGGLMDIALKQIPDGRPVGCEPTIKRPFNNILQT